MEMMQSRNLFFLGLLLLASSTATTAKSDKELCVYTVEAKTRAIKYGGTKSVISVTLADAEGSSVEIEDLKKWGMMGPEHEYFVEGGVDIFSGLGACLGGPACSLGLATDNAGAQPGWYCDYVKVTTVPVGPEAACTQKLFSVNQWLSPTQPATSRDLCAVEHPSSSA